MRPATTGLLTMVWVAATLSACKTTEDAPLSGVMDSDAPSTLFADLRTALEDAGCDGCHADLDDAAYKGWALKTKATYDRLRSEEPINEADRVPGSDFNPTTFGGGTGVYKAYPEYFRRYFSDEASWRMFAADVRPDPSMKVRGQAHSEPQKQRFLRVRDLMLRIAEQVGNATSLGCTDHISQPLKDHIRSMASEGWGPKLLAGNIKMYGCPTGTVDATQCFADTKFKVRHDLINRSLGVQGARVIQVADVGETSYWTRSSPDGRFVGNGGPARIDDLKTKTRFLIKSKSYDPGFFPDNQGWTFHGDGVVFCSNRTLKAEAQKPQGTATINGSNSWKVVLLDQESTANKPYCLGSSMPNGSNISTYQSIASGQGATSYVVTGDHDADPGDVRGDNVNFAGTLRVFELKGGNNRYDYAEQEPRIFQLPNEGDYMLSPSGTYVVGRAAGEGANGNSVQLGIRLRSLQNMLEQGASYDPANDPTMSSICVKGSGSKPSLSLDERFVAYHQYNGDKADIMLFDLLNDGKAYKITDVPPGKRAVFPHFLANNVLYFLLQDDQGSPKIIATDVAAILAQ